MAPAAQGQGFDPGRPPGRRKGASMRWPVFFVGVSLSLSAVGSSARAQMMAPPTGYGTSSYGTPYGGSSPGSYAPYTPGHCPTPTVPRTLPPATTAPGTTPG